MEQFSTSQLPLFVGHRIGIRMANGDWYSGRLTHRLFIETPVGLINARPATEAWWIAAPESARMEVPGRPVAEVLLFLAMTILFAGMGAGYIEAHGWRTVGLVHILSAGLWLAAAVHTIYAYERIRRLSDEVAREIRGSYDWRVVLLGPRQPPRRLPRFPEPGNTR